MNVSETLFAYSEWLDQEGLVVGEDTSKDKRSHDDLVADFLRTLEFSTDAEVVEEPGVFTTRDGFGVKIAEAMQSPTTMPRLPDSPPINLLEK